MGRGRRREEVGRNNKKYGKRGDRKGFGGVMTKDVSHVGVYWDVLGYIDPSRNNLLFIPLFLYYRYLHYIFIYFSSIFTIPLL